MVTKSRSGSQSLWVGSAPSAKPDGSRGKLPAVVLEPLRLSPWCCCRLPFGGFEFSNAPHASCLAFPNSPGGCTVPVWDARTPDCSERRTHLHHGRPPLNGFIRVMCLSEDDRPQHA